VKIEIKTLAGSLLFEGDFGCLKDAVIAAVKSRANLTGANLSRAKLYGANLYGANLYGAELTGAELTGANLSRANLTGANLSRAKLYGAELTGAELTGANLSRAELTGANLSGANLYGANLTGANGEKIKVKAICIFTGLYKYQVWAILANDGARYVRMGCLFHSLPEWEKIGILKSNENEFPNDGSEKSLERLAAFDFAKAAALNLK